MKKVISIIILVLALSGIIFITSYALTHKGIKEVTNVRVTKAIEKATTNKTNARLTDIYNIYLNKKRHKLKTEYLLTEIDNVSKITLTIYWDGDSIYQSDIISTLKDEQLLENDIFKNNYALDIKSFRVLKDEENEYLLIDVKYNIPNEIEKYYVFDNKGKSLISEGILVYDSSKVYSSEDEDLNVFYDNERQVLANILKNQIYCLELETEEDNNKLKEYKITISDGKIKKELEATYNNVLINAKKSKK